MAKLYQQPTVEDEVLENNISPTVLVYREPNINRSAQHHSESPASSFNTDIKSLKSPPKNSSSKLLASKQPGIANLSSHNSTAESSTRKRRRSIAERYGSVEEIQMVEETKQMLLEDPVALALTLKQVWSGGASYLGTG